METHDGVLILTGLGDLSPGSIELRCAVQGGMSHLIVGLASLNAPFKGGTLVPFPDLIFPNIQVAPDGSVSVPFTWPTNVPIGASTYNQFWVDDVAGPAGYSASNGLQATQL
jgi:hypothetical protein